MSSAVAAGAAVRLSRLMSRCSSNGEEVGSMEGQGSTSTTRSWRSGMPVLLGGRRGSKLWGKKGAEKEGAAMTQAATDGSAGGDEARAEEAPSAPPAELPELVVDVGGLDVAAKAGFSSWSPDQSEIAHVRRLGAREAHGRAVASLDAYRARLASEGPEGALEIFDAFCDGDEEIRRLRWKVRMLQRAAGHLRYEAAADGGPGGADGERAAGGEPAHYLLGGGSELWVDLLEDNKVDYRVRAPFDIPVDQLLSLFYETDLYPKWLPFVWEAKQLHMVKGGSGDFAQFIVQFKYVLPWPLKNREAVLYGFCTDCLEDGRFQLCAQTVPEGATEWWGYPIPPAGDAVRMDLIMDFGFVPQGQQLESTRLDIFFKLDPKIEWMPQGVLNWVGRQFVSLLYSGVSSICRKFDRSPYPARLKADVNGAYNLMYSILQAMRNGRLPEDDVAQSQEIST